MNKIRAAVTVGVVAAGMTLSSYAKAEEWVLRMCSPAQGALAGSVHAPKRLILETTPTGMALDGFGGQPDYEWTDHPDLVDVSLPGMGFTQYQAKNVTRDEVTGTLRFKKYIESHFPARNNEKRVTEFEVVIVPKLKDRSLVQIRYSGRINEEPARESLQNCTYRAVRP